MDGAAFALSLQPDFSVYEIVVPWPERHPYLFACMRSLLMGIGFGGMVGVAVFLALSL